MLYPLSYEGRVLQRNAHRGASRRRARGAGPSGRERQASGGADARLATMRLTAALVMCTRNRPDDVDGALTTIAGQTRAPEMVAVVDSSNSAVTREIVHEHGTNWPSSRPPIHVPSEPSLTHQRRVGLACTVSDVVLFVDDDVRLGTDFVEAVMQVFESDTVEAIGGVGGYMVNAAPAPGSRARPRLRARLVRRRGRCCRRVATSRW